MTSAAAPAPVPAIPPPIIITRTSEKAANAPSAVSASRTLHAQNKSKLKSDVKVCSAFASRVVEMKDSTAGALVKDVCERLSLGRFVDEVAVAVVKAPLKLKDIPGVTLFCCAMHQRYDGFMAPVLTSLMTQFDTAVASEDPKDIARRRVVLRWLVEMYLVGLVTDAQVIVKIVRQITTMKVQNQTIEPLSNIGVANAPAIVSIVRDCAMDLLHLVEKDGGSSDDTLALPEPSRTRTLAMLKMYCSCAIERLAKEREALHRAKQTMEKDMMRRGEVSELASEHITRRERACDDLYEECVALCPILGISLPPSSVEAKQALVALDEEANENDGSGGGGGGKVLELWSRRKDDTLSQEAWVFGDEDTRCFYEDLTDLFDAVPRTVWLKRGKKILQKELVDKLQQQTVAVAPDNDSMAVVEDEEPLMGDHAGNHPASSPPDSDSDGGGGGDTTTDTQPTTTTTKKLEVVSHPMEELLARLDTSLQTKRAIDEFVVDFVHLNTNASRKRLVQELCMPKRMDQLPLFARLAALVSKIYKDVGLILGKWVEQRVIGAFKSRKTGRVVIRTMNARYLGELVKFSLSSPDLLGAPPAVAFRVIRVGMENFVGDNIDMLCIFLESCGRELFRTPHTHEEMAKALETLQRHRAAKNLNPSQDALVSNAMYHCAPPDNPAATIIRRVRPRGEVEEYLRYLLLEKLGDATDAISKQTKSLSRSVLKLPWNDKYCEVQDALCRVCMAACKRRSFTLPYLCEILMAIQVCYPYAVTRVMDELLEGIVQGLDRNDFRHNQRRIAHMMFWGHAFRMGLLSPTPFWDGLFMVLNRGHKVVVGGGNAEEQDPRGPAAIALSGGFVRTVAQFACGRQESPMFHPKIPCAVVDPPWDAFRIRLVCACVDAALPSLFAMPRITKKTVELITHLDRYAWCKTYVPVDVECELLETLAKMAKRSRMSGNEKKRSNTRRGLEIKSTRIVNLAEAERLVDKIYAERLHNASAAAQLSRRRGTGKSNYFSATGGGLGGIAEGDEEEGEDHESEGEEGDGEEEQAMTVENDVIGEEEDEKLASKAQPDVDTGRGGNTITTEDAEFDAEFAKMMKETMEQSGRSHVPSAVAGGDNMVVPLTVLKSSQMKQSNFDVAHGSVGLSLLKKSTKGKIEIKKLIVPHDAPIAVASFKDTLMDEKAKKQDEVKKLVLKAAESLEY